MKESTCKGSSRRSWTRNLCSILRRKNRNGLKEKMCWLMSWGKNNCLDFQILRLKNHRNSHNFKRSWKNKCNWSGWGKSIRSWIIARPSTKWKSKRKSKNNRERKNLKLPEEKKLNKKGLSKLRNSNVLRSLNSTWTERNKSKRKYKRRWKQLSRNKNRNWKSFLLSKKWPYRIKWEKLSRWTFWRSWEKRNPSSHKLRKLNKVENSKKQLIELK